MFRPNCDCTRVSTSYGKTVFRCKKNGVTKLIPVSTTNINVANELVCELYHDNWENFPIEKKHCLAVSTPIVMADGTLKQIGTIEPGDLVLVCTLESDDVTALAVEEINFHITDQIVELSLDGDEPIRSSSTQEFLTSSGPVEALELSNHASLLALDGGRTRVSRSGQQIAHRNIREVKEEVASLMFDGAYCYFVGKAGWAVRCKGIHNGAYYDENGVVHLEP